MAITRSQIARQLLAEGGAPRQGFQMGSNVDEFRQPIAYDEFRRPIFYEDFQTQNQSDNDEDDRSIVDRARDFVSGNRQGILGSVLGSAIFGLPGAILGGFLGRRRDQGFGMFESARDRDARIAQETIAENFRQKQMAEEAARQLANRETGSITSAFGQTIDPGDLSVGFDSDTGQSFSEYSDPGTAASYEGSFADGGDVRQRYGLGKLVKKITRTVKKVAKSPIGKAAILGATLIPFGATNASLAQRAFGGLNLPSFLQGDAVKNFFIKDGALTTKGAITGILGASALAGMTAPKEEEQESISQRIADKTGLDIAAIRKEVQDAYAAGDISGLRTKYPFLIPTRAAAAEGGMMDLGGNEMDLRGGGFVPIGKKEKADDVPARLSKNEFVFTADAVRAAGGGSVDRGADLMYKTMKQLENKVA